jgi:hypothetical protein
MPHQTRGNPVNDDYLLEAITALLDPTRIRVHREDTNTHQWQTIPSIWHQLCTSANWGSQDSGTSKFGSRPVISTGVVALTIEITAAAREGANEHAPPRAGDKPRDTPGNLRAIAANLNDPDQAEWWTSQIRRWINEARSALRLDPPRPRSARGARCPDCQADTTYTDQDGEPVRTPALAITWVGPADQDYHPDTEWKVRAVECRCCGSAWFRGDSLDELIGRMLTANQTQETMTDGVA